MELPYLNTTGNTQVTLGFLTLTLQVTQVTWSFLTFKNTTGNTQVTWSFFILTLQEKIQFRILICLKTASIGLSWTKI
jgi:hypothetical protein